MCIAQNSCPNLLPSWSKLLGGGNRGQDVGCQLWSNWRRGRGDTQGKLPSACWQQPSQLLLAFVGWQQSSQAPQLNWKPHHGSWRGSNCQKENNTAHSLYYSGEYRVYIVQKSTPVLQRSGTETANIYSGNFRKAIHNVCRLAQFATCFIVKSNCVASLNFSLADAGWFLS